MNSEKFQLNSQPLQVEKKEIKKSNRWIIYLLTIIIILLLLGSCLVFFTTSTFVVPNFINTESLVQNQDNLAINGTEDRVIVRQDDLGQVTLLTPQPIGTSSAPTFGGLTVTNLEGNLKAVNGTFIAQALDLADNTEVMNNLNVTNGGTGINLAPTTNQILVGDGSGGYALKLIQAGSNITIDVTTDGLVINSTGGSSSGSGTVTNIATGNGLAGGPITTAGTISVNAPTCNSGERLSWNGSAFLCISTPGSAQNYFTGTSGSDFNIFSSGADHTFNIPSASTTARGLVTTGAQTFGGDKTFFNKLSVWDGVVGSDSIIRLDNSTRSQTSGTLYPLYITTRNDTTGGLTRGVYSVVTTGASNNPGAIRAVYGQIDYGSSATTASVMSATVGVTNINSGTVGVAIGGSLNTMIASGANANAATGGGMFITNNGNVGPGRLNGLEVTSNNSGSGTAFEQWGAGVFANNSGDIQEDFIGGYVQSSNSGHVTQHQYGLYVRTDTTTGGSDVDGNKYGVYIHNSGVETGGNVDGSEYGLYVTEASGGSTGNYGVYIAGASGVSPYALFVLEGVSRFAEATEDFASINIPVSFNNEDVASPNSGDIWWNGTNLYFYDGSSNIDLLSGGGGGGGADCGVDPCFLNGGNSFGGTTTLGTNDNNDLVFERNTTSIAMLTSTGFAPFADNTYDLGSLTNRWQDLYLGPASLHITSTTGSAGTGANYTDLTAGFSGGTGIISTTNNGTNTSGSFGALRLVSGLNTGQGAVPAISLVAANNLGSSDTIFNILNNNGASNLFSITANGDVTVAGELVTQGGATTLAGTITLNDYVDCESLETDGSGNLVCGTGGGGSSQWSDDGSDIYFNTGNVGIGNSDPQSTLDITGDARVSGYAMIGNFLQVRNTDFPAAHGDYASAGDFFAEGNALIGGHFTAANGVQVGNSSVENAGNIRWSGTDFEGWDGDEWLSFTSAGSGGSCGDVDCFVTGGNTFGATAVLGTIDNFNLEFRTNDNTYMTLDTSGNLAVVGKGSFGAATSARSSLNIASSGGTDPSSPNSGDLWWNGTNLNFRTGSSTVDLLAGGGGSSQWQDDGDNIFFDAGMVTVGQTSLTSGGFGLNVNTLYETDSADGGGIYSLVAVPDGTSPGVVRGLYSELNYNSTEVSGGYMFGVQSTVNVSNGSVLNAYGFLGAVSNNAAVAESIRGGSIEVVNNSTGTTVDQEGLRVDTRNQEGTVTGGLRGILSHTSNWAGSSNFMEGIYSAIIGDGTVATDVNGYRAYIDSGLTISGSLRGISLEFTNNNTVDSAYGILVGGLSDGAVNNYGLYIDGASGGSGNNYAIYVNNGDSYFAGGLRVGDSSNTTTGMIRFNSGDFEGWDGDSWNSFTSGGGGGSSQWSDDGSDIYFDTGFVGIGVSDPQVRLDVSGDFRLNGSQMVSSFLQIRNTDFPSAHGDYASAGDFFAEGNALIGGHFTAANGVQVGNSSVENAGNIRWSGTDFEGWDGDSWNSFTSGGGGGGADCGVDPCFLNGGNAFGTTATLGTTDEQDLEIFAFNGESAITVSAVGDLYFNGSGFADFNLMVEAYSGLYVEGGFDVYDLSDGSEYLSSFTNDADAVSAIGLQITTGEYTPTVSNRLITFQTGDGTEVGSIDFDTDSTNFNTTSDIRLKENISATDLTINTLMDIEVVDYNFKRTSPSNRSHGFIAQDLYGVYPQAVSVPLDPDKYWSVDYSKLVPLIVKSIQDQQKEIDSLEQRVTALEQISTPQGLESSQNLGGYFTLNSNTLVTDKNINTSGSITASSINSLVDHNFAVNLKGSANFDIKDNQGGNVLSVSQTGKISIKESSNGSLGKIKLPAGSLEVTVENSGITENSRIFLTPDQLVTYRVTSKLPGKSFKIEISSPLTSDINFDYFIIN